MTAAQTASQRGKCRICGEERPKGTRVYCSETCSLAGTKAKETARAARRMAKCRECGKDKEPGVRGSKVCAACREVKADAFAVYERQRGLRRVEERRTERIEAGERIARRTDAPDGTRWCAMCQEFRPLQVYTQHKGGKWAAYCKPCTKAYNHERRLRTVFGLSFDEYDALMVAQDGRCAICSGRPRGQRLAVDHDHKSGEIRGLLCGRCNRKLLGAANDSAERLRRAADYLDDPPARHVLSFGSADGRVIATTRIVTREVAAFLAANGFPHAEPAPGDRVDGIPGVALRVREDGLGLADDKAAEWLAAEPGLMVVRRHKKPVEEWWCWLTARYFVELSGGTTRPDMPAADAALSTPLSSMVAMLREAGYGDPLEESA